MVVDPVHELLRELEIFEQPAAGGGRAAPDAAWLVQAADEDVDRLLEALLARRWPPDGAGDAALATVFHQLAQRLRAAPGQPPGTLSAATVARIGRLHAQLGWPGRARWVLLQILAMARGEAALREFAERFAGDPPGDPQYAALALGPLFQPPPYDPSPLFPRLLDAIAEPAAAASVVDLANFVTRQQLVEQHPAAGRSHALVKLLGDLTQRLAMWEELPDHPDQSTRQLAERVEDSVALAVSLCDALAQIGDPAATGKLYQALELSHRRLRTEAAAALARLGEAAGEEALLALVAEPVARLRVLAYADELGLSDRIDERFASPTARAEAEVALWLAQPTQLGIPPTELEQIDARNLYWPGYDEPVDCFLFRFTYRLGESHYSNIAIAGPLVHAFAADLADLPPDDIYAAFAGWQAQHEEIFEVASEEFGAVHRADVARLTRRLSDAGFQQVQAVMLGFFFGEKALVARAVKDQRACTAVADAQDVLSFPAGAGPRACGPIEAYAIYKGRKLLRSFNP